jgi:hypothetical protein
MIAAEKDVQRELSYLDHKLFLDKVKHPVYGFLYYAVKMQTPDGIEPLTVVDWCAGSIPLPLSMDIVDRVRSQEGDIRDAISQVIANNAAKKELARQERIKEQEAVVEEWQARSKKFLT